MEEPVWNTELTLSDNHDVVNVVVLDTVMVERDDESGGTGNDLHTLSPANLLRLDVAVHLMIPAPGRFNTLAVPGFDGDEIAALQFVV